MTTRRVLIAIGTAILFGSTARAGDTDTNPKTQACSITYAGRERAAMLTCVARMKAKAPAVHAVRHEMAEEIATDIRLYGSVENAKRHHEVLKRETSKCRHSAGGNSQVFAQCIEKVREDDNEAAHPDNSH